jgi:hypothetical protein
MKNWRPWILVILITLLLMMSSILLLRQPILEYVLNKIKDKVKDRFDATLVVGDAGFAGFKVFYLNDIALIPANGDTLLKIRHFEAKISFRKFLKFRPGFKELLVDTTEVNLIRRDSSDNFSFFFKRDKESPSDTLRKTNASGFNDRVMGIFQRVNDIFNESITFRQFKVTYRRGPIEEMVSIPELYYDGNVFQSSVITSSKEGVNLWLVKGEVDPGNNFYDFHVKRTRGDAFALPFFDLVDNFKFCFDSAHVQLSAEEKSLVRIKGHFDVHKLMVSHWRIAPEDVHFPSMQFSMNAFADHDSIGLENGTVFSMNKLPVNITASYIRNPERRLRLNTTFRTARAQDLFEAMPNGMFYTFRGFKASGELDYSLVFDVPLDHPENLVFDSELNRKNFRIENYGTENFGKLNLPFSFLAMDGDRPVRSFVVGPENPYFTPLPFVSTYLQNAVLTAEDPSFMQHGGFVQEAFRESIITNLKQRRFARGGSTISMQLVKNVFLSRNKSVSRKIEEVMIVWLIEKQRLVSKERMLEVYLNIIEWGPNVYGIGEAARFYFNKSPDELTLAESIFLASLIPSPKHFRYRFDESGQLKPSVAGFFKLVSGRMAKREKISQSEADNLQVDIRLSGAALEYVLPVDTIPIDTLDLIPVPVDLQEQP